MTTYEDRDSMLEQLTEAFSWADTVAIGPGLGKSDNSAVLLEQVMKKWNHPMVVDADGLNLLAERMELLEQHEGPLIVTPHVGEFSAADRSYNERNIRKYSRTGAGICQGLSLYLCSERCSVCDR